VAQRRDQPSLQTSGQTWKIRLPDGSLKEMPIEPATAAVCCFCGRDLDERAEERLLLSARWQQDGEERAESWSAHRGCLAERLDPGAVPRAFRGV
jgi:hypothetical protein